MAHDVTDQLERRLLAARPDAAQPDGHLLDTDLLERLRDQPIARRRPVPRAVAAPAAVGLTVTAAAIVMLAGGPGDVAGPSAAGAAINQTIRWLTPAPHSVLHARSVETSGTHQITREIWQSSDDPNAERERVEGQTTFETAGDGLYDPATDTIYAAATTDGATTPPSTVKRAQDAKKVAVARGSGPETGKAGGAALPASDPIVRKVRTLLQDGQMVVRGREMHNGVDSWAVSLKPDEGRPVWTLWVSASDGKPLELRDPGRDANEQPQVIRWDAYEVLPGASADALLSLHGAHPSAHIVLDPAQAAAAVHRLMAGSKG